MPTLHVVIPFYDEEATLRACVDRVIAAPMPAGWSKSLVLIDDHSGDNTGALAMAMVDELRAAGGEAITLLAHTENRGKGAGLRTGFEHILHSAAPDEDVVIIQDADLEYDPADYPRLLEPIARGEAEVVYGSRFGRHRAAGGLWPRIHRAGNALLTAFSNLMTGYRVTDMECCYKLMPVRILRRVLPMLDEDRFGVEPQITAALARLNVRLAEVPVSYAPRNTAEGKKIGVRDGVRAIYVITRERLRRRPVVITPDTPVVDRKASS